MNRNVFNIDELEWKEKRNLEVTPDRRGFYKNLTDEHGLEQFEARVTRIPAGESNTWYHQHTIIEEWFFVLSGSCHFNLSDEWREISTGDSIATAPGEWHTFRNFSDVNCEILMVGINDDDDEAIRKDEPEPPSRISKTS